MRSIRVTVPGAVYHLISRFIDHRWFLQGKEERDQYLRFLGRAVRDSDWICLAFALMSNHIHFSFVAGHDSLESWAKRVHSPFADWINMRHSRIGPVFVRGPKSYAVPPDRVASLIAYIHNNPVRASVVAHARDTTWTSHRAYLGIDGAPDWLNVSRGLELAGFDEPNAFDAWVETGPDDPCRLDDGSLRRAAKRRGRIEVGTSTLGEVQSTPLVIRPSTFVRPDPRWFVQQAATTVGLTEIEVCSRRRSPPVVAARRIAAQAARAFGIAGADIAAALAISPTAVSGMLRRIDASLAPLVNEVVERVTTLTGAQVKTVPSGLQSSLRVADDKFRK